jgi:hypothetical protein
MSYLLKRAGLSQLTRGSHFKSGLLSDVMEEMTKFINFPYAHALSHYQFMGVRK